MKGRKTWERGYAAGLIDGEGCIQIKRIVKNGKRNPEYNLQININMCERESIDFMQGNFGGKIYLTHPTGINKCPNVYRWEISRQPALKFLKQILPFLRVKKIQAELGIRFQLQRVLQPRNKLNNKYDKTPQHILDRYEWYYQEMKKLKFSYISNAGATTKQTDLQLVGSDSLNLQ